MKKGMLAVFWAVAGAVLIFLVGVGWIGAGYRRPFRTAVEESGLSPALVYAVMKAESGFREDAVSRAGAVGLMQLLPATAEFICREKGMEFFPERLKEGEYNVRLGCLYLGYLSERFPQTETALAAYNAGEGTVARWLGDERYSADGEALKAIPYPETERYVQKVLRFRKNYLFFYHERT